MKLAIFDIDGTLTQTMDRADALFVEAVSSALGVFPLVEGWASYPHVTDSGIVTHLFEEHLQRAPKAWEVELIQRRYLALLQDEPSRAVTVFGASEVLQEVRAASGWRSALATGNWLEAAMYKLTSARVRFDGVAMATADDSHDRREILALAIERAGSSAEVVYVGDREWDHAAASALGIGFVGVGERVPRAAYRIPDYRDMQLVWRMLEAAASTPSG